MPSHDEPAFGFLEGISSLTLVTCTSTSLNACFGSKNLLSILSGARKPSKGRKQHVERFLKLDDPLAMLTTTSAHPPRTLTNNKDFCRLISGSLRLSSLNLLEELLEDPQQRLVVFGTEDLGDKCATFGQKLTGQLESHEGQMC